jgi:hypothetical protein
MPDPRAFVSFDYDHDLTHKTLFCGQIKNSRTPFNVEDWSSKVVLPQSEWEDRLRGKINRCNMLIVLVGRYMTGATGVGKEIAMAGTQDVPCFGVYVNEASALSVLPTGLARARVMTWEWAKIADMVDQMMTEGKNSKTKKASLFRW